MRVKMLRLIGIVIVLITFLGCSSKHKIIGTEFKNGDITFSANIYKPKGNGPFPAVIMVHGSKNHTKDYYTEYSKYFADNGIVTLNYDNRGHGKSEGNLWSSTFSDLASDINAAVAYLQTLDYVDRDKVGFWADSHGGWIVLIADSISDNIDFIISKSGPAVTPLKTVEFDVVGNYLSKQNVPDNEKQKILNLYPKIFRYLTRNRSENLWADIKSELDYFEPTPYFKNDFDEYYKELLMPPNEMPTVDKIQLAPSGRDFDFDPRPYLEKLTTRMFLAYGEADKLIPVKDCVPVINDIDNPNIEMVIYDNADHGIRIQQKPDILFGTKFPDGYFEKLVDFIKN
tara:strand:- start:1343 stop:2368 length:1026 start_codon:yes stop_codon:yes gene_type:complete